MPQEAGRAGAQLRRNAPAVHLPSLRHAPAPPRPRPPAPPPARSGKADDAVALVELVNALTKNDVKAYPTGWGLGDMVAGNLNDPWPFIHALIVTLLNCAQPGVFGPLFATWGSRARPGANAACDSSGAAPAPGTTFPDYGGITIWAGGSGAPRSLAEGLARAQIKAKCGCKEGAVSGARRARLSAGV